MQSLQLQQQKPQPSLLQALDAGLVVQLQALTAQLTAAATANSLNPLEQRVSSFNKVTLKTPLQSLPFSSSLLMLSSCASRNFSGLLILGPTRNAVTNQRRTPHRLSCGFTLFQAVNGPDGLGCLHCSNLNADSLQAHGFRAHQQLSLPSAGRAVAATEPGAVSEAASGAPAEGSYSKCSHIWISE